VNWKKLIVDPSFWILLITNVYLVYKYEQNPGIFSTLVWLYWSQSIIYGFFTFLTISSSELPALPGNNAAIATGKSDGKITYSDATAWFFVFHYGFFHVVYFVFLIGMTDMTLFNWSLFDYCLLAFFVSQAANFIAYRMNKQKPPADFGRMLAIPYVRVLPMHLCILIPAFIHVVSLTVFLVLKVMADVIMYALTNTNYQKNSLAEVTAINIKPGVTPD
jgi:hypothetical protein